MLSDEEGVSEKEKEPIEDDDYNAKSMLTD